MESRVDVGAGTPPKTAGATTATVGDAQSSSSAADRERKAEKEKQRLQVLDANFGALPADSKYGWGTSLGRFTYGFYTGVILSKERDDFSKTDLFLRFRSDLSFNRLKDFELTDETFARKSTGSADADKDPPPTSLQLAPSDVHTFLDMAFTSLPAQAVEDGTQFLESKKAFIGAAGIDYRVLQWNPVDAFKLVVAPSAFMGIQTFTEGLSPENENANLVDSVTSRWGVGVKIMGIQVQADGDKNNRVGHPNPLPRHFFAAYYGDDHAVGNNRLMIDSALVLDGNLFIGFGASLGRGTDDVRITLGFATSLQQLFGTVGKLVPDVLR